MLMLILFLVAALIYIYAPQIVNAMPAAEPTMTAYVAWVDGLRLWLDGQVQGLLTWLDAAAAASSN